MQRLVADAGTGFHFMPIVADDAVSDPRFVETGVGRHGAERRRDDHLAQGEEG